MRADTVASAIGLVLLGAALLATGTARSPSALPALGGSAPRLLSQTGLYAASGAIDPRNVPFVPQYPLWSDGASKARWIYLPEGTRIDASDVDAWRFAVGTRLWKEFSWKGRKVETRMIWKPTADTWAFAAYAWRQDGSDAELAPEGGVPDVIEVAPGRWHSIPGLADCRTCHASSPAVVLGFSALQLSSDRDPLAPHAETLVSGAFTLTGLVESDRLVPTRRDLVATPPRVRSSDPIERAAIGYLSANCGGCHNARGPLGRLGLYLLHDVGASADALEPALATTLDAPGRFEIPGLPPGASRLLVPGAPERSSILHRMRSRSPSSQMPPLGTAVVDAEATELLGRWIAGLERRRSRG